MGLSGRLTAALAAVAGAAVAVPAWVVSHPPAMPHGPRRLARVGLPRPRIVSQAELPAVEPVKFVELSPDEARAFNAGVPFSTLPNPAARPFRYAGSAEDLARATDCLAAGVLYEAGDDTLGERAVAQVVLNRLRHPAFPKTVCGVVFEGAERTTGCQFTFSCDGALLRWKPSEAAWTRARQVATMALSGAVFRPVGYSTHYHTDWVVPYWQSSLDKVAAVGSHLFFRWSGWWGTPPAFNRRLLAGEPVVAALAPISPAHGLGAAVAGADAALLAAAPVAGQQPVALASDPDSFVVALDPRSAPDSWRTLALAACGERLRCVVTGWTDRTRMPVAATLTPEQTDAMAFSYLRNREGGMERILWNCTTYPRAAKAECMKRAAPRLDGPAAAATPTPKPATEPLDGVRRHGDVPTPTPRPEPSAGPRRPVAVQAGTVTPPGTSPAAAP